MLRFVQGSSTSCSARRSSSRAWTSRGPHDDRRGRAHLRPGAALPAPGRVGRAKQRAFAYLVVPTRRSLTDAATMRLEALQRFSELGAGFQVASLDLELRGAGDLLGPEQSGNVNAVGFELYTEMLEAAVHELQGQPVRQTVEPELKLGVSALIPERYLPDTGLRLGLYKRLSRRPTRRRWGRSTRRSSTASPRPPRGDAAGAGHGPQVARPGRGRAQRGARRRAAAARPWRGAAARAGAGAAAAAPAAARLAALPDMVLSCPCPPTRKGPWQPRGRPCGSWRMC